MGGQLIFDLPIRAALNRHDFIVAPCNGEAVALIDDWQSQSACLHWLYGPSGCGKSHLAAVLAHNQAAACVPSADIAQHGAVKACLAEHASCPDILIIDALDELRPRDEEVLFHLLNAVRHSPHKRRLLLTSIGAPAHLDLRLPDLRSRLLAIPAIAMHTPDDDLLGYLLFKLFSDRQIIVDEKVVAYLVPRVTREYKAMALLVEQIDKHALTHKRKVTIPLIAEVLD
ncbi:MAG: AAA family ATPase [Alphaproteobacteria bacterium]|nr:AAA family ATPase [Alphaproteobacteria bacterium]MBE8219926.1 AAA family ATPase [Alphaproteobacteria bacterium]